MVNVAAGFSVGGRSRSRRWGEGPEVAGDGLKELVRKRSDPCRCA